MAHTVEAPKVITGPYLRGLVMKCAFLFAAGIALTAGFLYFSFYQQLGPGYGDSFRLLAQLKQEIFYKSIVIYLVTSVLIVAGIVVIALLYSHRVAGPLYRLRLFVRRVTAADLSATATLREKDVIQPLADELNGLITGYREVVVELAGKIEEIKSIAASPAGGGEEAGLEELLAGLGDRAREIEKIINEKARL